MKKIIAALALALSLAVGTAPALAAEGAARPANPVDQFTGAVWMQTSHDNKAAFLFGIETAITVEYFVNSKAAEKAAKEGKAPSSNLSRFEKGWMTVMKNKSRDQLIKELDAVYTAQPDKLDEPVMKTIWFSLFEPALAASK